MGENEIYFELHFSCGSFWLQTRKLSLVKAPSRASDTCAYAYPITCCAVFKEGVFYLISTLGILLDVVILSKSVDFVSPLRMIPINVLPSYLLKMPSRRSTNDGRWSLSVRR